MKRQTPRSSGRARLVLAALSLVLPCAVSGCRPRPDAGAPLALVSLDPAPGGGEMLLNDDLTLTFSEPIDPTSVTQDSIQLISESSGKRARGAWIVDGRSVRFRPRGVETARLTDGGFEPGATYRLSLLGFPAIGGVRSVSGSGLEHGFSASFSIVEAGPVPGRPVLRDASPDSTAPLGIDASADGARPMLPLRYDRPIRLACSEPLDPRSLDPAQFEVVVYSQDPDLGAEPRTVAIRSAELERNEDEDAVDPAEGARAVLRLWPESPLPLVDGTRPVPCDLRPRAGYSGPGICDFSGGRAFTTPIRFYAARYDSFTLERSGAYEFDFDSDVDFAPVLDPSSDGTARWTGTGRVEIRYPAAAGDGSEGVVELIGRLASVDVQATRLVVPAGETLELEPPPGDDGVPGVGGLVVLRSQGRLQISGTLRRRLPDGHVPAPIWTPREQPNAQRAKDTTTLSSWLAEARARNQPWTVVIAGGDLIVTGDIDVDTPLLLVAGGRIRGSGRPRVAEGQFWLLGEGGGFESPHTHNPAAYQRVDPPLVIDPPIANPLAAPVTFVAISSKVPKGLSPRFWGPPVVVASDGAQGSARVQYLDGEVLNGGEEGLGQAVRHFEPNGVVEPGSGGSHVRLRIELVARPGPGYWSPPYVDRVRLVWSPDPQ